MPKVTKARARIAYNIGQSVYAVPCNLRYAEAFELQSGGDFDHTVDAATEKHCGNRRGRYLNYYVEED